ncbi:MAG: hypothetical protein ABIY37_03170, partial [Devosia sp.]
MNPRFSLALIAVILMGGAVALWWSDRQKPADPVAPAISTEAISSEEAVVETDVTAFDGAYVLTVSWHPAFCETKPNLRECRNEQTGDYAADHFSLHGLWPQD